MTPRQLERLPHLLRDIVEVDREIAGARRSTPIDLIATGKLLKRRAALRKTAERSWGHRLGGEGSRTA